MGKTSVDARKHIREWSEFFADINAAGESLVLEFLKTRKKGKYFKQSLERFVNNGLIEKRKGKFFVSGKGKIFFRKNAMKDRLKDVKSWDGKWRLIAFDVPVHSDKNRYRLRHLLKDFGFYQLQKSVWVYPNYLSEELWKLLVDLELSNYCKVMMVEFLEEEREVREHFKYLLKS